MHVIRAEEAITVPLTVHGSMSSDGMDPGGHPAFDDPLRS